MLQTLLLLMKSFNKTKTHIFLSAVCSLFPKAIFLSFILKNQIFQLFPIVKINANYAEICRVGNLEADFQ